MTVDKQVVRLRLNGFELDEADARRTRAARPMPLLPRPFAVLQVASALEEVRFDLHPFHRRPSLPTQPMRVAG